MRKRVTNEKTERSDKKVREKMVKEDTERISDIEERRENEWNKNYKGSKGKGEERR